MSPNPLTTVSMRAARWSATHPWRAIVGWLALVVVAVGIAGAVSTKEASDDDYRLGESGVADRWVHEAGLDSPDSEEVLVTAARGDLDPAQADEAAARLIQDLRPIEGVTEVSEAQWNPDNTAMLISIQLAKDHDDADPIVAAVDDVRADFPELDIRQSGDLTLDAAIDDRVAADLSSAETISLPITLLLMLLAFGALIAAGIPVLLAATSVAATIGIIAPLSHLVPAESTVTSMIVLIGMAVGVDYSLFYLKREREERAKGRSTRDAVEIAAQTSGHSILVSGGAVIAAMAGLFLMTDVDLQQPRRRLDPGGRDRGARLDHRAARAAGQAGSLGGPPAGAAALAAQPQDRPGRHQPPRARSGAPAPGRRAPGRARHRGRPRRTGPGHEDPLRQPRHPPR